MSYNNPITVEGVLFSCTREAAHHYKIDYNKVKARLYRGWSVEQTFNLDLRRDKEKIIYKGTVYCISNTVNNKKYVGITRNPLEHRFSSHLSKAKNGGKSKLSKAIRRYGYDKFSVTILARVFSPEALQELEIFYINKHNSIKYGYNTAVGGALGGYAKLVTYKGKNYTIKELADKYSLTYATTLRRFTLGLPMERKLRKSEFEYDGVEYASINALASSYGIPVHTARYRLEQNIPIVNPIKRTTGISCTYEGKQYTSIAALAAYLNVKPCTLRKRLSDKVGLSKMSPVT